MSELEIHILCTYCQKRMVKVPPGVQQALCEVCTQTAAYREVESDDRPKM